VGTSGAGGPGGQGGPWWGIGVRGSVAWLRACWLVAAGDRSSSIRKCPSRVDLPGGPRAPLAGTVGGLVSASEMGVKKNVGLLSLNPQAPPTWGPQGFGACGPATCNPSGPGKKRERRRPSCSSTGVLGEGRREGWEIASKAFGKQNLFVMGGPWVGIAFGATFGHTAGKRLTRPQRPLLFWGGKFPRGGQEGRIAEG